MRIYGTASTAPEPEEQPIVAESFPQPGDRCGIYLGQIPASIEKELRTRNAFLTAVARLMFAGGPLLDQAVPPVLREQSASPAFKGNYAWHVTYVFERTVDVPMNVDAPEGSPFQWLDLREWSEIDPQLRQEATAAFDALLAYTVGIITPTFFDHVAVSLAMYYVAPDGRIAVVPQFGADSVTGTVQRTSPFPADELRARMVLLGQRDWASHAWLGRVWSWHSFALTEKPGWRLFMAAWTGLEILSRKAGRLALPNHENRTDVPDVVSKHMCYDRKRAPPIAADFAALTLELSPDSCEADLARFIAIKDVRDRLVHGEPMDEGSLPAIDARSLLADYIKKAISRYVGP